MTLKKEFDIAQRIAGGLLEEVERRSGVCLEGQEDGGDAEGRMRLERWLAETEEHRQLYREMLERAGTREHREWLEGFGREAGWQGLQRKLGRLKGWSIGGRVVGRWKGRMWRAAVVAGLVMGGGVAAWLHWSGGGQQEAVFAKTDVEEEVVQGKARAFLTLANGEVVDLEQVTGAVVEDRSAATLYNAGNRLEYGDSLVEAGEKAVYNMVTVPKCGEYKLKLSDGTMVYLNSASRLRYPVVFPDGAREVELEGEAYFEVAKDAARPFVVRTKRYDVTVLGTAFNVSAYEEEPLTRTTLVEGAVKVSGKGIREVRLEPDRQFVLEKATGEQQVEEVDVRYFTAWKDARFLFRDVRLEEIMRAVERWYGVTVFYEHPEVKDYRFGFNVGRDESIDPLLRIFEANGKVKIVRTGKVLRIQRGR